MPGRIYESLFDQATAAAGSATFYAKDAKTFTLAMIAAGNTPVAAYSVKLYATSTTPDAAAYTYKSQGVAGAVQVFENVADSNGVPFNFYKMVVEYSGLSASSGTPTFSASITAI